MRTDHKAGILPEIINLELTNLCNVACCFCDWPKLSQSMSLASMDSGLLRQILESMQEYRLYELGLVGLGEPLLDKFLAEHLRIVSEFAGNFERISINTNAVELNDSKAALLLDSALSHMTISLNASDSQAYKSLMGRDLFNQVLQNIKNFLRLKHSTNRNDIQVDIQIMEGAGAVTVAESLFDGFPLQGTRIFERKLYAKPSMNESSCQLTPNVERDAMRYPCASIFNRVYIDVEGWLYPCTIGNDCYRCSSTLCLGNVRNTSICAIYSSQVAADARERAVTGKLPFTECEACNVWSLLPNNFLWDAEERRWVCHDDQVRLSKLAPQASVT